MGMACEAHLHEPHLHHQFLVNVAVLQESTLINYDTLRRRTKLIFPRVNHAMHVDAKPSEF